MRKCFSGVRRYTFTYEDCWGKQSTSVTTVANVTEKVFCGNRHSSHAKHLAGESMEKHKIDEI